MRFVMHDVIYGTTNNANNQNCVIGQLHRFVHKTWTPGNLRTPFSTGKFSLEKELQEQYSDSKF